MNGQNPQGKPEVSKATLKNAPPRLLLRYRNELVPELARKFNYSNKLMAPQIKKIVINIGLGEAAHDAKLLEAAKDELSRITGQRPSTTQAKKAIANFKIRKNSPVGCKVTLRRAIMYEFLDRLINIAIPRIRDFRGLPARSFDARANYTFGLNEQLIFPEVNADKVVKVYGMDITIVMKARSSEEAKELLRLFGFPFTR